LVLPPYEKVPAIGTAPEFDILTDPVKAWPVALAAAGYAVIVRY
jgi:hypothetical protein